MGKFKGLNQGMATAVANASVKGLTPFTLFIEILLSKNEVSAYFDTRVDLNKLILDFEDAQKKQSDNLSKIGKSLEKMLSHAAGISGDRFITELKFLGVLLDDHQFNRYFVNIVGKYLDPVHVKEDIRAMIDPERNLLWEQDEETILDMFGKNLSKLAQEGEIAPVIGRDEEVSKMISILIRQTKANPILTGDAGVGKTALVEKLALLMQDDINLPSALHGYKLYEISIPAIVATQKEEDIIPAIVEACTKDKVILFMDEVHMIMEKDGKISNLLKPAMARGAFKLIGATTSDEFKVFEKDKAMTRRFQPVNVPESDKVEVYQILKSKAEQSEQIHNVLVPNETLLKAIELSERYIQHRKQPDKSIDLLEQASAKLRMIIESKPEPLIEVEGKLSDATIEKEMLEIASKGKEITPRQQEKLSKIELDIAKYTDEKDRLTSEYKKQRTLLDAMVTAKSTLNELKSDKADLLHRGEFDEATELSLVAIPQAEETLQRQEEALLDFAKTADENLIQNVVVPNMISKVIEDLTGIPVSAQDEDDIAKYHGMADELRKKVKGQSRVIDIITNAIKRSKAGLSDPNKPLGSFMGLGPTGVGKTHLAETIAEFMFDTKEVLHRFDMSEFMEPHSVARLFGSPPGYVGYDQGGQLTEAVKRNPYSIILFDEIEKAHSKVFDTLLQVLDAGRMTDGQGQTVDFKNTIIIMTSNLGSDIIRDGYTSGYSPEVIETALLDEIKKHFRPEFLNRFDAKVMFNALMPKDILSITEVEMGNLADRLLENNDLDIRWHPDVPVFITNAAYNLDDGARPIKRYINDTVMNLITDLILSQEAKIGDTLFVTLDDNDANIVIEKVDPHEITAGMKDMRMSIPLKDYKSASEPKGTGGIDFRVKTNPVDDDEAMAIRNGLLGGKKSKKKKKKKKADPFDNLELKSEPGSD